MEPTDWQTPQVAAQTKAIHSIQCVCILLHLQLITLHCIVSSLFVMHCIPLHCNTCVAILVCIFGHCRVDGLGSEWRAPQVAASLVATQSEIFTSHPLPIFIAIYSQTFPPQKHLSLIYLSKWLSAEVLATTKPRRAKISSLYIYSVLYTYVYLCFHTQGVYNPLVSGYIFTYHLPILDVQAKL